MSSLRTGIFLFSCPVTFPLCRSLQSDYGNERKDYGVDEQIYLTTSMAHGQLDVACASSVS